jgi:hypothetical protein
MSRIASRIDVVFAKVAWIRELNLLQPHNEFELYTTTRYRTLHVSNPRLFLKNKNASEIAII